MGTFNVSLKTLTERVSLEVVYTPKELDQINVEIAEVNRPGLFLAGYYDYFDKLRLQIMGLAEMNFLSGLSAEKRYEALEQLFRQEPPAVIVGRSEELEWRANGGCPWFCTASGLSSRSCANWTPAGPAQRSSTASSDRPNRPAGPS